MENHYKTLEKLKERKNPLVVPDNYFEQLEQKIAQQTEHIAPMKATAPNKRSYWKPFLYLAAMFAGAFLIVRLTTKVGDWVQSSEIVKTKIQDNNPAIDFTSAKDYTLASLNEYALYEYYCEDVE